MLEALGNPTDARNAIHLIFETLVKRMGITTLIVGEIPIGAQRMTYSFKEFIVDGVILMEMRFDERTEKYKRSLRIEKMRGTPVLSESMNFTIDDGGIRPYKKATRPLNYETGPATVSTGIAGLDEMLDGGVKKGFVVAVEGDLGTGKTNVLSQFINEGLKNNERCLMISTSETKPELAQGASSLGLDWLAKLPEHLRVESIDPDSIDKDSLIDKMCALVEESKPQRLAFGSISDFFLDFTTSEVKDLVQSISSLSKTNGMTSLVSSTTTSGAENRDAMAAVSDFFDGIVVLGFGEQEGTVCRSISVSKMRRTRIGGDRELEIHKGRGVVVLGELSARVRAFNSRQRARTAPSRFSASAGSG
jgi:circadian clock protein KaiC